MTPTVVEVAQKGQVTIPKAIRDKYGIEVGQQYTVLDIDGVLIFSPKVSRINALLDKIRDGLVAKGATLEDMLAELRRMRETDAR